MVIDHKDGNIADVRTVVKDHTDGNIADVRTVVKDHKDGNIADVRKQSVGKLHLPTAKLSTPDILGQ